RAVTTRVPRARALGVRHGERLELVAGDRPAGGPDSLVESLEVHCGTECAQFAPSVRVLLELDAAPSRDRLRRGRVMLDARLDELTDLLVELIQGPGGIQLRGELVASVHLTHRQARGDDPVEDALHLVEADLSFDRT